MAGNITTSIAPSPLFRSFFMGGFECSTFKRPKGERLDLVKQSVRLVTDQLIRMGIFYDVQATLIANRLHGVIAGNSTGGSVGNAFQWTVD